MWRVIAIGSIMFIVGSCSWKVGEQLSSDSIAMLLGLFFGVFAGLPVALLAMHNNRIIAEKETETRRLEWLNQDRQPRHEYTIQAASPKRLTKKVINVRSNKLD